MATSYPTTLDHIPEELLEAVVRQAVADAEGVAHLVDNLGLRPSAEGQTREPLKLPAYFLLGLAAAFRIQMWEDCGLCVHREAGLPSANEVVSALAELVHANGTGDEKLSISCQLLNGILGVAMERLAWAGQTQFSADLALGEVDEETLVETLAKLLWDHRHDGEKSNR
jgi:hypothetical protein